MFKNLNRTKTVAACVLALIGTCSAVFAIDFSQAFTQSQDQSVGISKIFQWKATVSNLYTKALKLAKDNEVVSTMSAFDQLAAYYDVCPRIQKKDFINVLYHANASFRDVFNQIFWSATTKPENLDFSGSYQKFFACKKIYTPTINDFQDVDAEINKLYQNAYINSYSVSTINQDNYGSDFFWNGSLDDSDFDILYDINQIGKILFDDFKDTPQILFYTMPTLQQALTQWWGTLSSLTNQGGSYQVGPSWTSTSSTSPSQNSLRSSSAPSLPVSPSSLPSSVSSTVSKTPSDVLSPDKDVQTFIATTNNTTPQSAAGSALIFGNQCLSWDTSVPVADQQQTSVLEDPVAYISGITAFINDANLDQVINQQLLTQFHKDSPLASWASTSDSWVADSIANTYAEQAFGNPPTSSCNNLPLDQQAQCELSSATSCIKKCDGLWIQDKALCISDCTCFMVAWPNGAWWQKVEDMFRIKFCKVPVQEQPLQKRTKVYSIQAIFQEIFDVLNGLKNSGQMVKFSKTKEYLDGNIKINFADNFAFKLQVDFKPVFPQKSDKIKIAEQTQNNSDLNQNVLGMNTSNSEADNYNKYIIISDPATNKANLEPVNSLADVAANIDAFTLAAQKENNVISSTMINNITSSYAQNTNIVFVNNMLTFLADNQLFLNNLSQALLDMTKMSIELKTKIENSK